MMTYTEKKQFHVSWHYHGLLPLIPLQMRSNNKQRVIEKRGE